VKASGDQFSLGWCSKVVSLNQLETHSCSDSVWCRQGLSSKMELEQDIIDTGINRMLQGLQG
jgi:hypothetical protein